MNEPTLGDVVEELVALEERVRILEKSEGCDCCEADTLEWE